MGESPSLVFKKILQYAAVEQEVRPPTSSLTNSYNFKQLKKYAKVCTAWKNSILASKKLINGCDKYYFEAHRYEEYVDFIQYGFLSVLERIKIGGVPPFARLPSHDKMEMMGFIQAHVKHNVPALEEMDINICEKTNIEALADILASSPHASSFKISFNFLDENSILDVQQFAETCWKVLLSVFYCNTKAKTVRIDLKLSCQYDEE